MKLSENIYIEIIETTIDTSSVNFSAYAAIRLLSCPSGRLREFNLQGIPISYYSKQVDLINTLYQVKPEVTYAIRYISNPHPESFSAGSIDVCIFCKVTSSSKKHVKNLIEQQIEQLLVQLCGTLTDYKWEAVQTQQEFLKYFEPFDWTRVDVVDIRRREELIVLDSIISSHGLGFNSDKNLSSAENNKSVHFIHPFLPHTGQLERLLRLLLLNPERFALTISLHPIEITKDEEQSLLDEISNCEGFYKEGTINLQRIQEQRAQMVSQALMSQLLHLQDAPFMVMISLVSSGKIANTLAEAAGVAVSAPVGEGPSQLYSEPSFVQMGGYDIAVPTTPDEKSVARNNSHFLEQNEWGKRISADHLFRLRYMMAGQEAANAFRFPEENGNGLPGIPVHTQRTRQLPHDLFLDPKRSDPTQQLFLGSNTYLGIPQEVHIPVKDRLTHMYLVGQTGTGKSTLLKTMILSDITAGRGCALIDPHGDLFEELLGLIPPDRIEDVVIVDPSDIDYPIGLNLLQANNNDERHFVVREMQAIMRRLVEDQYGQIGKDYIGPFFFQHMQMNMLLAMSDFDHPGTLLQFYQIYHSASYWKRWIPLKIDDPILTGWVNSFLANNNYTEKAKAGDASTGEYLSNKFTDFVFDPRLRGIFGQPKSTIDFQLAMNEGKIILINLAKGLLGEANSRFLGFILMAKFQAEAMKRAKMPPTQRKPFFLYIDEFQSLATENFTILLSEARKFGMGLILANQFISQIRNPLIMQSVFGNVGSFLSFRLGREDAQFIEPQYLPFFDQVDLANLPNWHVAARLNIKGKSLSPFTLQTVLPSVQSDPQIAQKVRELSRNKYSTPRSVVEKLIEQSLHEVDPDLQKSE